MKGRIYYTLIVIALLAGGCDKSEPTYSIPSGEVEISFSGQQELSADWTKGLAVEDINSVSSIGVFAFVSEPADYVTACYLDNVEATKVSSSEWGFSPSRYYPLYESLDFLAYSPMASSSNGVSQSADFDSKTVQITYSAPNVGRNQPDLMVATPATQCNSENELGTLYFQHALTQLSLSAKVNSATDTERYVITRFTMHDITTTATMDYSVESGASEWVESYNGEFITSAMLPDPVTYPGEEQVLLTDEYQSIMSNGHTLFMIPQAIEKKTSTAPTIQITIYDTQSELTYRTDKLALPSPDTDGWIAGQHVNLLFEFDVTSGNLVLPMTLTAELNGWWVQEVSVEVEENVYAYLNQSSVESTQTEIWLYTNGTPSTTVGCDGVCVTSASLSLENSNGYYPITISTGGSGSGWVSVKILKLNGETSVTKIFNISVL